MLAHRHTGTQTRRQVGAGLQGGAGCSCTEERDPFRHRHPHTHTVGAHSQTHRHTPPPPSLPPSFSLLSPLPSSPKCSLPDSTHRRCAQAEAGEGMEARLRSHVDPSHVQRVDKSETQSLEEFGVENLSVLVFSERRDRRSNVFQSA
eukprot:2758714-Rhodomonas_salina.1